MTPKNAPVVRGKSHGDSPKNASYRNPRRIHLSGLLVRSVACCSLFACCSVVLRALLLRVLLLRVLRDCVCGLCSATTVVLRCLDRLQVLLPDFLPIARGLETTSAATASGRCTLWNYPNILKKN